MISIQQPWASLVVAGIKDVENRTWMTLFRGPVLVHSSGRQDPDVSLSDLNDYAAMFKPLDPLAAFPLSGIIGMVTITNCVRPHKSEWYAGTYLDKRNTKQLYWAFTLADARPLPFVPCKGSLGIRDAPEDALLKITL